MLGLKRLITLAGFATAVFRDEAGVIDSKSVALGTPLSVSQYNNQIAIVGDANVLGVIDENGILIWRQILTEDQVSSNSILFRDQLVLVGGEHFSAFNATDGSIVWTLDLASRDIVPCESGVQIGEGITVDFDGNVIEAGAEAVETVTPKIEGSQVQLPNGTLSWDEHAVLTYRDSHGEVKFTRNDGLAHIVDAAFVRPFIDAERALTEDFGIEGVQDGDYSGIIPGIANRLVRHLYQLYELAFILLKKGPSMLVLPESPKESFEFAQILVLVTQSGSVYAMNTTDSAIAWVYHDLDAAKVINSADEPSHFFIKSKDGSQFLMSYDGEFVEGKKEQILADDTAGLHEIKEEEGARIVSPRGWSIKLPGDKLVGKAGKDPRDVTASVTVPIDDKGSILFKYLNPYAAAFASYSSETQHLTVTILDTVTGRILSQFSPAEPVIINEEWPFNIAFGEHWVVFTYLSRDETQAPKLSLLELYETGVPNERKTTTSVNVFNDTLIPHVKQRSWNLRSHGGPVYSIGLSKSLFGASAREILLAFEHQVVAIPRFLASTFAPPAPLLEVPASGHLSHIFGVAHAQKIVTGPTGLESTYMVAAVGGPDLFMSKSAPSGEFDRLNASFPKVKLVVFVAVLAFAVSTMSPLARMKALKQQWR